ncbi:Protein transport protein yif1 [Neonectria punicea]|uniref:Protein transport protein yif1 n=1 Tax=Neonectria punicea TaxID=979145 RepID=A0ABR1GTS3_9HYPO
MSLSYSPMVTAMIQSATLGGLANVLAQVISSYRTGSEVSIDWVPVFQFLLFNLISTPPNFIWQDFLESTFPAHPEPPHPKKSDTPPPPPKLSIRNTAIKLVLDQTVGAALNTLLFSTFTHSLRAALHPAPRITNLFKAITFWTSSGTVDLTRVDFDTVWAASLDEFWSILIAGWRLWPAVALINFSAVKTVQGRNLVGSLAGVVWGIYMSLLSAQ